MARKPPGPQDPDNNGTWNRFDIEYGNEQMGRRKARKERKRIVRKRDKGKRKRGDK